MGVGISFAFITDTNFILAVAYMGERSSDRLLDLRGWSCPWCILKTKSWLARMEPGEILEVLCTDPSVRTNFPRVLERTGHRVMRWENKEDHLGVLILRGYGGKDNE